jgi:hypothetical protein
MRSGSENNTDKISGVISETRSRAARLRVETAALMSIRRTSNVRSTTSVKRQTLLPWYSAWLAVTVPVR